MTKIMKTFLTGLVSIILILILEIFSLAVADFFKKYNAVHKTSFLNATNFTILFLVFASIILIYLFGTVVEFAINEYKSEKRNNNKILR